MKKILFTKYKKLLFQKMIKNVYAQVNHILNMKIIVKNLLK